ncbi:helicase-related protein, partial [Acidocella sp.]|uniref:helicase-related protein n=1 Tax=Acidocella sp. TaxID=50710 RepID=UPI003D00E6A8
SAPDTEQRLYSEIENTDNWPALVFVSSPDKANKLATDLVKHKIRVGAGQSLSRWMVDNYGAKWELSDAILSGIGVHHGRIPRALASRFIKLFNDKKIPVLICTSTLIEGVNTAAKSVLIYDKTIAKRPYDFFTFSNIRGRAGRLGQHHVGRVFLFHAPPAQENVEVTAPLFGDPDEAPDEFVVHMEEEDASPKVLDRVQDMAQRIGLEASQIRRFSGLGIDTLLGLRSATYSAMRARADIVWNGWPSYEQLQAVCTVICKVVNSHAFGCASERQLAMYINKLRHATTMREFYHWHSSSYKGQPELIDNVFKFLRAAEYSLPEYFAVVELFIKTFASHSYADYSLVLADLPRWFRAEPLKILEERGVPIQISERIIRDGDTVAMLSDRLRRVANSDSTTFTPMEKHWINDALPR